METPIEERLAELATGEAADRIRTTLDLARDFLGTDLAYFTQFKDGQQVYRGLSGDAESFGMGADDGYPLDGSYCQRMVLGKIPNVIADMEADSELATLAITELGDVGAYVGVPVEFSDGRLYGTLCGLSHDARPDIGEREVSLMRVLAAFLSAELEREVLLEEKRRLERRIGELEAGADDDRVQSRIEELVPPAEFGEPR